jgi:hypothetical protein
LAVQRDFDFSALAYFLETVLVLVSVGVILVSMAEITWDLASRFTIRPGQPTH